MASSLPDNKQRQSDFTPSLHSMEIQKSAPLSRLAEWCTRHMSQFIFMIVLAIVTGIASGAMAHLFKKMIRALANVFIPHIMQSGVNWWIIGVPLAGILLTGIFTRYIIHKNLTHVVAQLLFDIRHKMFRLRHDLVFSAVLGGTVTLGMGGSSGAEGPIAATGAAIGSNLGQILGLDNRQIKILLACGASAGIAGIFSAPIGGLMFSLELMRISLSTVAVLAVTVAALTAYLTSYACNGFQSDLIFQPQEGFEWATLPAILALGVFCGLYSLYYSSVTNYMDKVFRRIINPWWRNLTGGIMLGIILLLFPSMYGVGYPVLTNVVGGDFEAIARGTLFHVTGTGNVGGLMLIAAGILVLKCWAVSATNSSGGVGGDFAPTLFAGGIAGFLFASFCNFYMGTHFPVALFAFYGMAGVMSGVIRTPLMSIFIVVEMSMSYALSLPVSLCAFVSYLTVKCGAITEAEALPLVKHLNWFK